MKLILTEDVQSLGDIGSIVQVKGGYARNYLLPRSLAVLANESNRKELEHKQRILAAKRVKIIDAFKKQAKKLEKLKISISKQVGEDERIFGSVTSLEISSELEKQGFEIAKKDIKLVDEIKTLGKYNIELRLHSEVTAKLKIIVEAQ